jgi:hypothetical protein
MRLFMRGVDEAIQKANRDRFHIRRFQLPHGVTERGIIQGVSTEPS